MRRNVKLATATAMTYSARVCVCMCGRYYSRQETVFPPRNSYTVVPFGIFTYARIHTRARTHATHAHHHKHSAARHNILRISCTESACTVRDHLNPFDTYLLEPFVCFMEKDKWSNSSFFFSFPSSSSCGRVRCVTQTQTRRHSIFNVSHWRHTK